MRREGGVEAERVVEGERVKEAADSRVAAALRAGDFRPVAGSAVALRRAAAVSRRAVADSGLARVRRKGYRRINLRAFPHYLAYVIREPVIWIVAIAHGHRRPEYWIDRI